MFSKWSIIFQWFWGNIKEPMFRRISVQRYYWNYELPQHAGTQSSSYLYFSNWLFSSIDKPLFWVIYIFPMSFLRIFKDLNIWIEIFVPLRKHSRVLEKYDKMIMFISKSVFFSEYMCSKASSTFKSEGQITGHFHFSTHSYSV